MILRAVPKIFIVRDDVYWMTKYDKKFTPIPITLANNHNNDNNDNHNDDDDDDDNDNDNTNDIDNDNNDDSVAYLVFVQTSILHFSSYALRLL